MLHITSIVLELPLRTRTEFHGECEDLAHIVCHISSKLPGFCAVLQNRAGAQPYINFRKKLHSSRSFPAAMWVADEDALKTS